MQQIKSIIVFHNFARVKAELSFCMTWIFTRAKPDLV